MSVTRRVKTLALSGRTARAAALTLSLAASAYLMGVAIASPAYWWLGWVTLLPLFYSIRVLSPGLAFCAGSFWGCCLFFASFLDGGPRIAPNLLSLAFLTLTPGLYASFGAGLTRQVGFSPYLLALGWVWVEFALRPVGLRYGLLAGTQGNGAVLGVIGSFTGYVLVAFLVAYVNATLLSVLSQVRVTVAQPRLVTGASGPQRRVIPLDLPSYLSRLFHPAQPRAPPA